MNNCIRILALLGALAHAPVFAQPITSVTTTDRTQPFIRSCESIYGAFVDAETRGDLQAYRKLRTRETYAGTLENLARTGKSEGDLRKIILPASGAHEAKLPAFSFVRAESSPTTARLLYVRNVDPDTLDYEVIMFALEDGAWRVGALGSVVGTKSDLERDKSLDTLLSLPRFTIGASQTNAPVSVPRAGH